ncbi:uncharacterized protein LOC143365101 [Halictus rubicundus]
MLVRSLPHALVPRSPQGLMFPFQRLRSNFAVFSSVRPAIGCNVGSLFTSLTGSSVTPGPRVLFSTVKKKFHSVFKWVRLANGCNAGSLFTSRTGSSVTPGPHVSFSTVKK